MEKPELSRLTSPQPFSLAEGLTATCGDAFLGWLSNYLVGATGLDHALVGEFVECDRRRIGWRAISRRGVMVAPSIQDLRGSPLERIADFGSFACTDGLGRAFAADGFVRQERLDAGAAILIEDSRGEPLGVLAVFHGERIEDVEELLSLLRLFAARLAGELELLRAARCVRVLTRSDEDAEADNDVAVLLGGVSRALGVKVAFVAELVDADRLVSRTLALTIDGQLRPNIEYRMHATPCEYILQSPDAFHPVDVRLRYPDDEFLAEVGAESYYSMAFFGSGGEPIGHLGVIHDAEMPEGVRHSPLLRALALRGRDALRARAADGRHAALRRHLLDLQELQMHGQLLPGAVHDLRNLLTALQGSTEQLVHRVDDPEARRHAARADAICGRAQGLLARLLDQIGRKRPIVSAVDLNQLVAETIELLRPEFGDRVAMHVELDPGLPRVPGSPAELGQLAMNIILNAMEACGPGGRIRVATTTRHLDATALSHAEIGRNRPAGRHVCLYVDDNGPGIPDEIRPRIFELRYTTRPDGRGLGLAVVKEIASRHRAAIDVVSRPGEGTSFRVYFGLQGAPRER